MATHTTVTTTEYDAEGRPIKTITVVTDGEQPKPMPKSRFVAVIFGDFRQFSQFQQEMWDSGDKYVYAHSPESLRGYRLSEVVTVGTWWSRPNVNEIIESARAAML